MSTPFYQDFDFYAVGISLLALGFSFYSYAQTDKRGFSALQLNVVLELIDTLNKAAFSLEIDHVSNDSLSSISSKINLFELDKLYKDTKVLLAETAELPILFGKASNQLFDLKPFIDNPLLPKSIADDQNNFYLVAPSTLVWRDHLKEEKVILINSGVYISNTWDDQKIEPSNYLRQPSGFAYVSVENFLVCADMLEKKIIALLSRSGISEVNIRKDFNNV